ncbi:MAG: RIP metalloprotease [Proteobacteria bacterium]|nr:RIP metalloprotease [Pseudomonadota bacterium]
MTIFLTIVGLLIVLGVVVFIHELGHYFAARISGVRVDAFSIGFRPVLRWRDKRGTEWRLGWIPFGGYCLIYGQEDMFDRKKYAELPAEKKKGHYLSASAWRQAFIIAGGVIMNFALAFAIYWGLNLRPQTVQLPVIAQVIQDSPAYNAGIRAGDIIAKIDGKKISNWGELLIAKELAAGHDAQIVYLRPGTIYTGPNKVPRKGEKAESAMFDFETRIAHAEKWGLIADPAKTTVVHRNVIQAGVAGARETWTQSKTLVVVLKQMITGERSSKQLGSFITIAQVSGKALAAGFAALFSIIALLSVNLGVVNLLPLPVLDGGYLLILGVEGIIRRKLQGKAMEYVFWAGWIIIGLLFALTMKNDIFRLFGW